LNAFEALVVCPVLPESMLMDEFDEASWDKEKAGNEFVLTG
jgi:hypothetical protein